MVAQLVSPVQPLDENQKGHQADADEHVEPPRRWRMLRDPVVEGPYKNQADPEHAERNELQRVPDPPLAHNDPQNGPDLHERILDPSTYPGRARLTSPRSGDIPEHWRSRALPAGPVMGHSTITITPDRYGHLLPTTNTNQPPSSKAGSLPLNLSGGGGRVGCPPPGVGF
jgi:hypothetical protein